MCSANFLSSACPASHVYLAGPVTPLGRLGEPEDIAAVAVFLASDESSWGTGETIRVGGGAR
jgi:NAD(P)-dependent dehydrogenase (short-subunit alcohol dehydrogenase family)